MKSTAFDLAPFGIFGEIRPVVVSLSRILMLHLMVGSLLFGSERLWAKDDCSRSLLGRWTQGFLSFLSRHDLTPFELGSELKPLQEIEASLDRSLENQALAAASFAALESSDAWESLGEEQDFGTHVPIPALVQGEVIAGLDRSSDETWKFVAGKVVRVHAEHDLEENVLRTRLTLRTPEGQHDIYLPGAAYLHRLKRTQGSRIQRALQKIKTIVENKYVDAKDFYEEIVATKGLKVVLRARNLQEEKDQMRWAGLLRKERSDEGALHWVLHPIKFASLGVTRLMGAAQNRPDWKQEKIFFAPSLLQFAHQNLIRRPSSLLIVGIEWTREELVGPWKSPRLQKFFSRKLEFSSLVNVAGGTLAFVLAYNFASGLWDNRMVQERNEVVMQMQDEWLFAVQTDPFLDRVYQSWTSGELNDQEAAEEAYLRLASLDLSYDLMNFFPETENIQIIRLIEDDDYLSSIYPATMFLKDTGPIEQPGIAVPEYQRSPATDEELAELVQVNRDLFERRPLVMEWIDEDFETIEQMIRRHPELAAEWEGLQADPYNQSLWEIFSAGRIDEGELLFLMLENLQWKEKFARWAIFDAVRYSENEDGSRRALKLTDFQNWRLRHLFDESEWIRTQASVDFYPHKDFNNRHLLDRLGPNLTYIYALGTLAPFLRRFISNPKLFRGLIKGRYKNAMKARRAKAILMLTAAGEVQSRTKQSHFTTLLTLMGTLLIAWDIYAHWEQAVTIDDDVREVLENPYIVDSD